MSKPNSLQEALDAIERAAKTLQDLGTRGHTQVSESLEATREFLIYRPDCGITMAEYARFREKIETKIKGLDGSAGEYALRYLDGERGEDKDAARKFAAEAVALREVIVELNRARDATMARLGTKS